MNETGIQVVVGQTGGTHSSDCIVCINYGTAWMMIQNNITGIGMWTGGHAWLDFNGSTNYPLYLAPIRNIPQNQMTDGFQHVINPKTGEHFLIGLSSTSPSASPTSSPENKSSTQDMFNWQWACICVASGSTLLAMLYLISWCHNKNKKSSFGKDYCGFFKGENSLFQASLLNNRFDNSRDEMRNVA